MKTLILCDSGLGGLDIAAPFFRKKEKAEWEMIYINAWPDPKFGYNDLADSAMQEAVFQAVLEGMERFSPALCMIACNTLSIVWRKLSAYYQPSFPVMGIIEEAVKGMTAAAQAEPDSHLLILGTATTVSSGVYSDALRANGIAADRIHSLACPGLAKLIEKDPAAPEVRQWIKGYAETAAKTLDCANKLHLCFCCTHYGYAESCWKEEFGRNFPSLDVINPNRLLVLPGSAASFAYHSRLELEDHQRQAMSGWFAASAAPISEALRRSHAESGLFTLPSEIRLKKQ